MKLLSGGLLSAIRLIIELLCCCIVLLCCCCCCCVVVACLCSSSFCWWLSSLLSISCILFLCFFIKALRLLSLLWCKKLGKCGRTQNRSRLFSVEGMNIITRVALYESAYCMTWWYCCCCVVLVVGCNCNCQP